MVKLPISPSAVGLYLDHEFDSGKSEIIPWRTAHAICRDHGTNIIAFITEYGAWPVETIGDDPPYYDLRDILNWLGY